jgi:hypothetical protein
MDDKILAEFEQNTKSIGAMAIINILKKTFKERDQIIYSRHDIMNELQKAYFEYSLKLEEGEL